MPGPWEKYQKAAAAQPQSGEAGPWQNYGSPQAAGSDTQTTSPAPPDEGLLDGLADWGAKTFAPVTPAENPNSYDRFEDNTAGKIMRNLTGLPAHIQHSVGEAFDPDTWLHPFEHSSAHFAADAAQPGTPLKPGQPLPKISGGDLSDYGSDLLGDTSTSLLLGDATDGLLKIPGVAKDWIRGEVDEPMPGTDVTPRQRYTSAKNVGVNLPPAQATNNPFLKTIDRVNREGLFSAPMHERLAADNMRALDDTTGGLLDEFSPLNGEAGGQRLQDLLRQDQDATKVGAQGEYDHVRSNYGDRPVKNLQSVVQVAKQIQKENKPGSEFFPAMEASRINAIVDNFANLIRKPAELKPSLEEREFGGGPKPVKTPLRPNVSTLIDGLSDLQDMYRNNPELVKSKSDAMLQRLVEASHQAVSDSLPDEARGRWEYANQEWKNLKSTYDDPSSPYYHAIRTPNPSTLAAGVGGQTPEAVRGIRERTGLQGLGIVQRGTAEKLLGSTGDEGWNFRRVAGNLERLPDDYADELFGEHRGTLRDIGRAARALDTDYNPSGSGKNLQRFGELSSMVSALPTALAGHPGVAAGMVAEPLLQYPVGKVMTSPKVADWLMAPSKLPNRFYAPTAAAGTYRASRVQP